MQSYEWQIERLGESIVYPGHPIVIAAMIIDRYESLASALRRREGHQFNDALEDSFVPGAGCAVHSALRILQLAGENRFDECVAESQWYWDGWEAQSASNAPKAAMGRMQAQRVMDSFKNSIGPWRDGTAPASRWRAKEESQESRVPLLTPPTRTKRGARTARMSGG